MRPAYRVIAAAGLLLALVSLQPAARAADLWVDRNSMGGACSDQINRDQVTEQTPWCTLGTAGSRVQPGDTVYVRAGHYTEIQTCLQCNDNSVLQAAVTGTSDAWIRFMAAQGEQVEISGQDGATHGVQVIETYDGSVVPRFIEIRGFYIHDIPNNCVQVKDTTDVVLRQLETANCDGGAVELHHTARVTLESSLIHDNHMDGWTSAVDLYLCYDGNVVRGNFIWGNYDADPRDTEGHGITMDTCEDAGGALIENNVIWGNEGWCMAIYQSDGSVIRNNTCWMNGLRTPAGEISVLGHHHVIHNNILISRDGALALNIHERNDYPIDFSTIESDANLLWAPTHTVVAGWGDGGRGTVAEYQAQNPEGWGTTTIQQDPLLADPAATDFHLTAGSPAIDSGDDSHAASIDVAGGIRPFDGDGDSVAVVDMGAYEFDSPPNASDAAVANPDGSHAVDAGGNGNGGSGKSGCGCRSTPTGSTSLVWLLLCAVWLVLTPRSGRSDRSR